MFACHTLKKSNAKAGEKGEAFLLPFFALQAPPLFWQLALLAFVAGMAARVVAAAWVAWLLLLWAGGERTRGFVRVGLLALCFGAGMGWIWWNEPVPGVKEEFADKVIVRGMVESVRGMTDGRLSMLVKGVEAEGKALGKVQWVWDSPITRPLPGQMVEARVRIRQITGFRNKGVRNSADYWAGQGVYYSLWTQGDKEAVRLWWPTTGLWQGLLKASRQWRESLREQYVAALAGKGAEGEAEAGLGAARAMLPALLFGDRFYLSSEVTDLFTRAGLVHSLALSGQHLALAGAVAWLALWLAGRARPNIFLLAPRKKWLAALSCVFAAEYLWLGGAPPSLIRAAIMMFAGMMLLWGNRAFTVLDTLFVVLACFCLAWPMSIFDLGVQLSFGAVAGIALALPWVKRLTQWGNKSLYRKVAAFVLILLLISVAAQMGTLPFQLESFGTVSMAFPLNALWLPILGFWVLPMAALGLFCLPWPALAAKVLGAAAFPAEWFIGALQMLDDNGHGLLAAVVCLRPASFTALGYGAALLAFACRRGGGRLLVAALLLLPFGSVEQLWHEINMHHTGRVELRMLDVGQGQSLVLEWPGGRLVLDAGGSASPRFDPGRDIVAHALTANRPPRLNWLIASHDDLDHAGGLRALAGSFAVGGLARPAVPLEADAGKDLEKKRQQHNVPLLELKEGDWLELTEHLRLHVLHPPERGRFRGNNSSLVLRLVKQGPQGNEGLALLCGDAQLAALGALMRSGHDIKAGLLILPHHGSLTSLLPEFYEAVQPEMAFISYGIYNSFGFPKAGVLEELARQGIPWRGTGHQGELVFLWE